MGLLAWLFGPVKPDKFAALVMREIRAGGYGGPLEYDPAEFRLLFEGNSTNVLFLSNAYEEYARAPRGGRAGVIRKFASLRAGLVREEASFEEVQSNLLPRVQSRVYHELTRLTFASGGANLTDSFVNRTFTEQLALDIVYDRPDSIQTVTAKQLADWGTDFDAALAVAKENLWRRSNERWLTPAPGVHVSPWSDTHDASRLFLHDLIWQLPVKGDHVAIAPNRVMLIVTGAADEDGLGVAAEIAEEALELDRVISGQAVRLCGNVWRAWLPPEGRAAHWPLKKLAIRTLAMDYGDQADVLEKQHERTGLDVFVAKFVVKARADGTWFTFAVWALGVDSLLPQVEWLSVGRRKPEGGHEMAGWVRLEAARRVSPGLFEHTEHHPPRYRVRGAPSAEQLEEMGMQDEPG